MSPFAMMLTLTLTAWAAAGLLLWRVWVYHDHDPSDLPDPHCDFQLWEREMHHPIPRPGERSDNPKFK